MKPKWGVLLDWAWSVLALVSNVYQALWYGFAALLLALGLWEHSLALILWSIPIAIAAATWDFVPLRRSRAVKRPTPDSASRPERMRG